MIELMLGACLDKMRAIPAGSVDMVLTDPPYGTTACKWDTVIDLEAMWDQIGDVLKPNGACVLTASQPFTSRLVMSNPKWFKYCWVWDKGRVTGALNAKRQPMRRIEDVCVFYYKQPTYNPQGVVDCEKLNATGVLSDGRAHQTTGEIKQKAGGKYKQSKTGYPNQVIAIRNRVGNAHPTQKPVALMEYLINTYTNPGNTVLDFTMGSGSTGVACVNTGRKFIGIELDAGYFAIAERRIQEAQQQPSIGAI